MHQTGLRQLSLNALSFDDALRGLIQSEDPWLTATAATLAGQLGRQHFLEALESIREHPYPLVKEAAEHALAK